MKGPSSCEPFGEPLAVPSAHGFDVSSCEEKGSPEGSAEPSPENQGTHDNHALHEPSDEPFSSYEGSDEGSE